MKRNILLCLLFFGSFQCLSQTSREAFDYLSELSAGQQNISEQLMRYISASAHSMNAATIERKRRDLIQATERVQENVQNAEDFYGDSSLRDAMLTYFDLSLNALQGNYKEIAAMREQAESDYEVMKALLEAEEEANKNLDQAQRQVEGKISEFTGEYEINLVEEKSPLSAMIAKSNEVSAYYNQVFLPLFRVNLQNIRLKEALDGDNVELIEQERKLTEQYAEEAREIIDALPSFYSDESLKLAGLERIDYYVEEANVMGLTSIEYQKLSRELEEQKKQLESLKPAERNKEMIDSYNVLVEDVNELSNELNHHANRFNQLSQQALRNWQQLVQAFKQRHIPKYGLHEQQA